MLFQVGIVICSLLMYVAGLRPWIYMCLSSVFNWLLYYVPALI
jgi:hypothetical protein